MAYIGNSPTNIQRGRRAQYHFTASVGQTAFTGTDDNGLTLDLLESVENDVYFNGVRLILDDDYTISGDTLTLTAAAAAGDILVVVTQDDIVNLNSYTKAEADDRYINYTGDVVNGDIQVVGNISATDLTIDTDTLYVDATNNRVGIGTTSPNSKIHSVSTDAVYPLGLSGTTKGLRFETSSTRSAIQGVDSTLNSSYQPIMLSGSTVELGISNSPKVTVNSSGNVGIGSYVIQNGIHTPLHVGGAVKCGSASASAWANSIHDSGGLYVIVGSGSEAFDVWDDNEQTTPRLRVKRDGRVGIGTASPYTGYGLTVSGKIYSNGLVLGCTSANQSRSSFIGTPSNVTNSANMLRVAASGNDNVTGNVMTGISLGEGYTGMYGYDAGGSAAMGTGFFAGSINGVNEVFYIDSTKMVINEKVGIGASPTGTLTVFKDVDSVTVPTAKSDYSIVIDVNGNVSGSYVGGIAFGDSTVSTAQAAILAGDAGGSAATDIAFATGTTGGISERMRIDYAGRVTMPHQPCFHAQRSGTYSYTVSNPIVFNSVVFDQGGNYNNSTGIFTAPVTGRYFFTATVLVANISQGYEYDIQFWSSNRTKYGAPGRTEVQLGTTWGNDYIAHGFSSVVDMDAGDTAYMQYSKFDGGSIYGGVDWTHFSGFLVG